jgi:hypothetical protein
MGPKFNSMLASPNFKPTDASVQAYVAKMFPKLTAAQKAALVAQLEADYKDVYGVTIPVPVTPVVPVPRGDNLIGDAKQNLKDYQAALTTYFASDAYKTFRADERGGSNTGLTGGNPGLTIVLPEVLAVQSAEKALKDYYASDAYQIFRAGERSPALPNALGGVPADPTADYLKGISTPPDITAAKTVVNNALSTIFAIFANGATTLNTYGQKAGETYTDGVVTGINNGMGPVARALGNIRGLVRAESPPGPASPLHLIDVWGKNTGQAYLDGLTGALTGGASGAQHALGLIKAPSALTIPTIQSAAPTVLRTPQINGDTSKTGTAVQTGFDPRLADLLNQVVGGLKLLGVLTAANKPDAAPGEALTAIAQLAHLMPGGRVML